MTEYITLKTEKLYLKDLTDREKQIYDRGFSDGVEYGVPARKNSDIAYAVLCGLTVGFLFTIILNLFTL